MEKKDSFENNLKEIFERFTNPLISSILISISLWNIKWIFLFLKADEKTSEHILSIFEMNMWDIKLANYYFSSRLLYPIFFGLFYFLLSPFLRATSFYIYYYLNRFTAKWIILSKNKVPISSTEAEKLHKRIIELNTTINSKDSIIKKHSEIRKESLIKLAKKAYKENFIILRKEEGIFLPEFTLVTIKSSDTISPTNFSDDRISGIYFYDCSEGALIQTSGNFKFELEKGIYKVVDGKLEKLTDIDAYYKDILKNHKDELSLGHVIILDCPRAEFSSLEDLLDTRISAIFLLLDDSGSVRLDNIKKIRI